MYNVNNKIMKLGKNVKKKKKIYTDNYMPTKTYYILYKIVFYHKFVFYRFNKNIFKKKIKNIFSIKIFSIQIVFQQK